MHAWKIFSKSLLNDEDEKTLALYRQRQHICRPSQPLQCYVQPLLSPTIEFISHLVISGGCDFATNELLCLADMRNLGVLELIQPADELQLAFPTVSNSLVRGWAEKDDPFPLLRVLRIWGDESTTQDSLISVAKFPSLALYDVMGLREDWSSPHDHAARSGWELAEPATKMEDSLLKDLMLLSPPGAGAGGNDDMQRKRQRDMARSIDSDLVSLCADSRCAVRFVEHGQAPRLLDYMNDSAKVLVQPWGMDAAAREGRSCHEKTFEAWAFWLYSLIGQLTEDRDLVTRCGGDGREVSDTRPQSQAVVGPFVLPSKPMACLFLGHSGRGGISTKPSYVSRGLFVTRRYIFTRRIATKGEAVKSGGTQGEKTSSRDTKPDNNSSSSSSGGSNLRKQKRRRMDEMLDSFNG